MSFDIKDQGNYDLFDTTNDNRILTLNHKRWFAWVHGQKGEILVLSDAGHEKKRTVQTGRFYLVDFTNDPTYNDIPHLFLEKDGRFEENILPNGLPTPGDTQKKIVRGTDSLALKELDDYLKGGTSTAGKKPEKSSKHSAEPERSDSELPIPNYRDLNVGEVRNKLDSLNDNQLQRLRNYEHTHKNRKTLMQEFDRVIERRKQKH